MSHKIVFLPGDGAGPEVAEAALNVLNATGAKFDIALSVESFPFGGAGIDATGAPLPEETKAACLASDAVFLGAVGGPKWDGAAVRPEQGLLALRQELGVFANLRPIKVLPGMERQSPLREEIARGIDILIIRELTGGVYFGEREEGDERASDVCTYTKGEVERVARVAFEAAKGRGGRVTSVDKANVMATSRLWRKATTALRDAEYSEINLDHGLIDAMAMKLITSPGAFDVMLTENMFGDILSDEASVIGGSIGLAPSASLGVGTRGLYEPIHGSAPDIAGQDKANPVGAILSAAMMLRHSLGNEHAARAIENAIDEAVASGRGTGDIGGDDGTQQFADHICDLVAKG
ncbi:MAG: 3-isopropylmalate dehydrogenase [Pseudomonadota bacterium]